MGTVPLIKAELTNMSVQEIRQRCQIWELTSLSIVEFNNVTKFVNVSIPQLKAVKALSLSIHSYLVLLQRYNSDYSLKQKKVGVTTASTRGWFPTIL